MTTDQTFIIAGAGLAGAKAAETLRAEGFDGRLVLIGAEPSKPYDRPPLSKDYLRGDAGRDKLPVFGDDFYDEQSVELRLGRPASPPAGIASSSEAIRPPASSSRSGSPGTASSPA